MDAYSSMFSSKGQLMERLIGMTKRLILTIFAKEYYFKITDDELQTFF